MILYFSATGNSAYVAKQIAHAVDDECYDLFSSIRTRNYTPMTSVKPWVLVVPTYAWQIPHIVEEWLRRTPLLGNKDIYFVMTCAGSIGNASASLVTLCYSIPLHFCGCAEIIIPENYIALFRTPDDVEAHSIIEKAEPAISIITQHIKNKTPFEKKAITSKDKFCSGFINKLFYPMMVKADKFYVQDNCIGCGACVSLCPLANIHLQDGQPVWGTSCTHCMACINRCPQQAIEYGKHTMGLQRYTCPK